MKVRLSHYKHGTVKTEVNGIELPGMTFENASLTEIRISHAEERV